MATEQIAIDHFNYLNNDEAPAIIDQTEAQDLLNVEISHSGKSVKKRSGYGTYKTLSGSQPIHGGYHFFDASGNDVQVWGSSTSLWGIVADAAPTQLISSATLNSTWDCADSQGSAYCVDSSRDALIKTNGATKTWYTSPLGTMVAITPERLLIGGVSAAPNSIYISAASDFTNFTVGINPQDSFVEQIASPGSRLTHIEYACQRWLWWKDQSFGYVLGTDQTNLKIVTVSNTIGTQDNSSAIDPNGNVYFRAQDGHIYQYDCSNLTKLTQNITPSIQTSGRRTSNLYSQSSQTEFQTGTIVPTNNLSTTISPGDVVPSSFTATDDVAADWNAGTLDRMVVSGGSIRVNYNASTTVADNSFESGSGSASWEHSVGAGMKTAGLLSLSAGVCGATTFLSPKSGSVNFDAIFNSPGGGTFSVQLIDGAGAVLTENTYTVTTPVCSWTQGTLTATSFIGKAGRVRLKRVDTTAGTTTFDATKSTYTIGGNITYWYAGDKLEWGVDLIESGISSVSSGTFTSRTFDTGATNGYALLTPTYTTSGVTPNFVLQHSANGTAWTDATTSTTTSVSANRYVRYISSFTPSATQDVLTTLDSVNVISRSSGTYYSPVVNRPNLTSWDTLNATYANNSGAHTFYLRASTSTFTVLSSTPAWTAQTPGAVISISTGTFLQFRDDFGVTASSQNPTLSDFQLNWFEGTASDKAYAIYFDNAVWWALAYGAGQTTNNYVFRYDLIINGWSLYDIGATGFLLQNNALYFGSPSSGALYRYGGSTSDNGAAISAYWKSKDFPGSDPWLENSYNQLDTFAQRDANTTLTVAYSLNASTTTTSYSISLSNTTDDTIRHKKLLPAGKIGGLINVKFSDSSSTSAWEILGFRVKSEQLPYRPTQ